MTKKDYAAWAKTYVARFGISDAPGMEMVLAWYDELSKRDATIEDLDIVSERIKPDRRDQHRGFIFGGLTALRYERNLRTQTKHYLGPKNDVMNHADLRATLIANGLLGEKYMRENKIPIPEGYREFVAAKNMPQETITPSQTAAQEEVVPF